MIDKEEELGARAKLSTLGDRTWWNEADFTDPFMISNHNLLMETATSFRQNLADDQHTSEPQLDSSVEFRSLLLCK